MLDETVVLCNNLLPENDSKEVSRIFREHRRALETLLEKTIWYRWFGRIAVSIWLPPRLHVLGSSCKFYHHRVLGEKKLGHPILLCYRLNSPSTTVRWFEEFFVIFWATSPTKYRKPQLQPFVGVGLLSIDWKYQALV